MSIISKSITAVFLLSSLNLAAGELGPRAGSIDDSNGLNPKQLLEAIAEQESNVLTRDERDATDDYVEAFYELKIKEDGSVSLGDEVIGDSADIFASINEEMQDRILSGEFEELAITNADIHKDNKRVRMLLSDHETLSSYTLLGAFTVRYQRSTKDKNDNFDGGEGWANESYNVNFSLYYSFKDGKFIGLGPEDEATQITLQKLASESSQSWVQGGIDFFYGESYSEEVMTQFGMEVVAAYLNNEDRLKDVSLKISNITSDEQIESDNPQSSHDAKTEAEKIQDLINSHSTR